MGGEGSGEANGKYPPRHPFLQVEVAWPVTPRSKCLSPLTLLGQMLFFEAWSVQPYVGVPRAFKDYTSLHELKIL